MSAADEFGVQFAFELGDRGRKRRLRHVTLFGGSSEMPLLRHGDKVLQLTKEHDYLTVAWQLIDATAPYLSADQRTLVFVELGCGEHHRATERILAAVIEVSFPLSAALLATLTTWLDLYTGSSEEHRLRTLLAAIAPT